MRALIIAAVAAFSLAIGAAYAQSLTPPPVHNWDAPSSQSAPGK